MRSLAIDELHTLHLGLVQRTASACIYRIVLANPWGFQGTTSSVVDRGVRMRWTDLKKWQANPASGVRAGEELRNLTPKMLGKLMGCSTQDCEFHLAFACSVHVSKQMKHCFMSTCVGRIRFVLAISKGGSKLPDHPGCAMSMKAGESAHLLKFAIHALEKYTQENGLEMFGEAGAALVGAAVSLQAVLDGRRQFAAIPDAKDMRYLKQQLDIHIRCCKRSGIALAPKAHLATHLIDRLAIL